MEEMGMTDLQFKSFLKMLLKQLEEIKDAGVSEEAAKKIEELEEGFKSDIES